MGLDVKYPAVESASPADADIPIYSEDGVVTARTGHANVMCLLPDSPSEQGWFRRPPWPPYTETHEFIRTADARLLPSDYPVPHPHGFDRARFVLAGLGADHGWRTLTHPRFVADLTGDGRGDLVGFGDDGVWTALGDGQGGFAPARFVLAGFAPNAGEWRLPEHPRHVADITGDGRGDLVGFGDDGVWTALGDGAGSFGSPGFVLADFGSSRGWDPARHVRVVRDLTGDGRADILGFGEDSVWVALASGDGGFAPTRLGVEGLGHGSGWRVETHLRTLADLTGDGCPDIVAFGDSGVWVALADGQGGFGPPQFVLAEYGVQQGWTVATRPRLVADVTGDGRSDLIGFREDGLVLARGDGSGGFAAPELVLPFFGAATGHVPWDPQLHPRLAADLTGNGAADVVGFADDGTWVAVFDTQGPLGPQLVVNDFGVEQAWQPEIHHRVAADLTGDARADIVGFGDAGVYVSLNLGTGPRLRPGSGRSAGV